MKTKALRSKFGKKFRQAGMTLTESLLVLGIGAMAAAIAYGGYKMATSTVAVSSQTNGTIMLIGGIKRIFSTATDYSSVTVANVINAKIVPSNFRINGTTDIFNDWGGTIIPAVGIQGAAIPVTKFKLTISGVTAEQCADFVNGISSAAESIWVNGTTVGTHDVKPTASPVNSGRLITQCSAGTTSSVIAVIS